MKIKKTINFAKPNQIKPIYHLRLIKDAKPMQINLRLTTTRERKLGKGSQTVGGDPILKDLKRALNLAI